MAYLVGGAGIKVYHKNIDISKNSEYKIVGFADEEPPSYGNSCPQDIRKYTDKNDDVYITWTPPKSTDNSGEPTSVRKTGLSGSSKYPVGTTTITYSAKDTAGLTTICSFSISVISK